MILSHARKFVFIKTFKTAGSSLEIVLAEHCGPHDILTPLDPDEENMRWQRFGAGARNYKKKFREMSKREIAKTIFGLGRPEKFFEHSSACQVKNIVGEKIWSEYFTWGLSP